MKWDIFRKWILKILYPITVWVGNQRMPFSKKLITGVEYYQIHPLLSPGIIFLTRTRGELSNILNPGFWKHGAMYLGDNQVIEALGCGVVIKDLISFLLSKDYVAVLAAKFATDEEMFEASKIAKTWEGSQYDYWFEMDDKVFYCYEVIYRAYKQSMEKVGEEMPFTMRKSLGSSIIIGDDFFEATDKWQCLWHNKN